MTTTRQAYVEELTELEERALGGLDLVVETLTRTLEAIEHSDVELAEMVIADDDRIDGRYLEVHQSILTLLATQQPVATDLRLISALLHVMKSIERMGDQCVNIAKVIPLSGHEPPRDAEMITRHHHDGPAGQVAGQRRRRRASLPATSSSPATSSARTTSSTTSTAGASRRAIEIGDDVDDREWGITMMLVARALERIGDNAVDIGEQTAFVVTGLFREFEDASHPGPAVG